MTTRTFLLDRGERPDEALLAQADELMGRAPNAHFTQHPGWLSLVPPEDARARPVFMVGTQDGRAAWCAAIRLRRLPVLGQSLADLFRGPVAESPTALGSALECLEQELARFRPFAVRIDPYWDRSMAPGMADELTRRGYRAMAEAPWHTRSLEIDIDRGAEELLESYKPATRRQVRKALRMSTEVREDLDDAALERFDALYRAMSDTKGASARSLAWLRGIRDFFRAWPHRGFFLSSWDAGELLGAISVFTLGRRAIYAYGASSLSRPEIPKSHLLHFEAMQRARARGCLVYDMGGFAMGVGDEESRTPTQKINYFKSGFGGHEVDFVSGHERIVRPVSYGLARRLESLWRRARRSAA